MLFLTEMMLVLTWYSDIRNSQLFSSKKINCPSTTVFPKCKFKLWSLWTRIFAKTRGITIRVKQVHYQRDKQLQGSLKNISSFYNYYLSSFTCIPKSTKRNSSISTIKDRMRKRSNSCGIPLRSTLTMGCFSMSFKETSIWSDNSNCQDFTSRRDWHQGISQKTSNKSHQETSGKEPFLKNDKRATLTANAKRWTQKSIKNR